MDTLNTSRRDALLQALKRKLLVNTFPDPISEQKIVDMMKDELKEEYSRSTVREVIAILKSEGYIEQMPSGRLHKRKFSPREKAEIVVVRNLLEQIVAKELAHSFSGYSQSEKEEHAKPLNDILTTMESYHRQILDKEGNVNTLKALFFEEDNRFHSTLASEAKLPFAERALRPLQAQVFLGGFGEKVDMRYMAIITQEHRNILDSIVAGDGDLACQHIVKHISHGGMSWGMESTFYFGYGVNLAEQSSFVNTPERASLSPLLEESLLAQARSGEYEACRTIAERYRPLIKWFAQPQIEQWGEAIMEVLLDDTIQSLATCLPKYLFDTYLPLDQHIIRGTMHDISHLMQNVHKRLDSYQRTRQSGEPSPEAVRVIRLLGAVIRQNCSPEQACYLNILLCDFDPLKLLKAPLSWLDTAPNALLLQAAQAKVQSYLDQHIPQLEWDWNNEARMKYIREDFKQFGNPLSLHLKGSDFAYLFQTRAQNPMLWSLMTHIALCKQCRETFHLIQVSSSHAE